MSEPKKQTIFDIIELQEGVGPKMGLGGWGLPGINTPEGATPAVGPVMGYCLEKISFQFNELRGLSQEGENLMQSLRLTQTQAPASLKGGKSGKTLTRKERQAIEAKEEILSTLDKGEKIEAINLQALLEKAVHLPHDEKKDFLEKIPKNVDEILLQITLLTLLRSAGGKTEFIELQKAFGGEEAIDQLMHDTYYGAYQCLLENYEIVPWKPPFHHPLFQNFESNEGAEQTLKVSLEGLQSQVVDTPPIIREEYMQRFMIGDITAAEVMGLTREELYMIAKRGYDLLQEGKFSQAQIIFDGLVYLDPYDPYFYTVLGSVRQRQEDIDGALACYNQAIRLQPWNVNALANRGEIFFNQGKLTEAMEDFQKVIAFDSEDKNPSTLRVKTLVLALGEALEKRAKEMEEQQK